MKKLLSILTSLVIATAMLPTALAGGSAAHISIATGNPSGYIQPGRESTIMKFNVHANTDIILNEIRVDLDGSGVNFVDTLDLVDENGVVVDSVDAVERHYFNVRYVLDQGEDHVFTVMANIADDAASHKNLSFDVSIGEMETEDPETGTDYYINPATLQGSEFNFGGLFSSDATFSNFQAVDSNRGITPGDAAVLSSFWLDYKEDLTIETMSVRISGTGQSGIERVYLRDSNGVVITSDLLNSSNTVTFRPNYQLDGREKFDIYVRVNSDAQSGGTMRSEIYDANISTPDGDLMWLGNDLPYTANLFTVVGEDNDPVIDVKRSSQSPKNPEVSLAGLTKVFVFEISPETDVNVNSLKFNVSGTASDDVEKMRLKYYKGAYIDDQDKNYGGNYIFFTDLTVKDDTTQKFEIWVDLKAGADKGDSGMVTLSSIDAEDNDGDTTVNYGLPSRSKTFYIEKYNSGDSPSPATVVPTVINNTEYEELILNGNLDNPFDDIDAAKVKTLEGRAALYLSAKNIIRGYLISTDPVSVEFRGWRQLNRAESVKFIVNSLKLDDDEYCHTSNFSDVPNGKWYTKYVCTAQKLGIVNGNGDGTFAPGRKVKKAEFVKMLIEAHNLPTSYSTYDDVSNSAWYAKYAGVAQSMDLFPDHGDKFRATKVLTRWETTVAVYLVMMSK